MKGFPGGSEGKASACNAGDLGLIPGSGRSPGEGNGNHASTLAWKIPWTEKWVKKETPWSVKRIGGNTCEGLSPVAGIFWCSVKGRIVLSLLSKLFSPCSPADFIFPAPLSLTLVAKTP